MGGSSATATLLLGLLLLALVLRVFRLDSQSLWYDEAVTAEVTAKALGELTRWTAADIQPPLYYYLVAGWTRLMGRSEWALRFPSLFFGILTVPLLWATARRIFGRERLGRIASWIAALLASVSPLYVYYSQEARMYTLLMLLGNLTGYALLRVRAAPRWWTIVVAAAVASLYTHYFAGFLLAAYGALFLVASFGHGRVAWRGLRFAGISGLLILLAYVPWLPAMVNRFGADRSYWSGALKLSEAMRHLAISFTSGAPEMMLEEVAVRWLPWFGGILVVALASLLLRSGSREPPARYGICGSLLVVLLLPIGAILLLASRTPKFNPRYLMMVSPSYLLILAGGLARLLLGSGSRRMAAAAGALGGIALVFLSGVSLYSLNSWFTDPAFTKAQWRELSSFVRDQIAPDEQVLLVSGHSAPAWSYYAPDLRPLRLPELDVLDVDAVLDFQLGASLSEGLSGKTGAWLVTWQDELVDPVGFVPYFLDRGGSEEAVERQFWHVSLRHWRLRPDAAYPAQPDPDHSLGANYSHKIAMLGWDDPEGDQITLYWQALNTLTEDYQVSLVVETVSGEELSRWDGRPAGYNYPTTRWRIGHPLFGRYPMALAKPAPVEECYISVAVFTEAEPSGLDLRDIADNPAGKRIRLGPIPLR